MKNIAVLGGCGGIGSVCVRALASVSDFDQIWVADNRLADAKELVQSIQSDNLRPVQIDANQPDTLKAVLANVQVVVNCIGPFYRYGPPLLKAAIEAGIDYVDVCDDLEPTQEMLRLNEQTQAAGVSALIGMGNSPGISNLIVKLCAQSWLDQVHSVDIMHIHGGEPHEGPAVVKHRIHAMQVDVPLFIDGEFVLVRQLEESGQKHTVQADFVGLGSYPVYPYPHPETLTLPTHIAGLQRVTNLGVVFPLPYFKLTQDMVRAGACGTETLWVQDNPVIPLEFAVAHILSKRPEFLKEAGIHTPGGCLKIVIAGTSQAEQKTFEFSISSTSAGAGEGTGIPAACGAILMARGEISQQGVFPPEAGISPMDFFSLAYQLASDMGLANKNTIQVECIAENGHREVIPLAL